MRRSIQYTGDNVGDVVRFLGLECWCKCSGDLAVRIEPASIADRGWIETVPVNYWVGRDGVGVDIQFDEF